MKNQQPPSEQHSTGHYRPSLSFITIPALLIFAACGQPPGHTEVVPDSTLVLVLTDLYIADAASTIRAEHRVGRPDSLMFHEMQLGTRDQIIESHGVSVDQFTTAIQQFIDDPPRYVALYNRILDHLNLERRSPEVDADSHRPSE